MITRRHFLISAGAALGACFVPGALLRRAVDHANATNGPLIEGPDRIKHTLYARERDTGVWQFSLDDVMDSFPQAPSWRLWLSQFEGIDPLDRREVTKCLYCHGLEPELMEQGWRDQEVPYRVWESYLEFRYLVNDSAEAHALRYLESLRLSHGPILDPRGLDVGTLHFYYGTMPGADSHFVEAEGEFILPALQHRLRELGEDTLIKVTAN